MLLRIEVGRQAQFGHADDRIHRRADFVAHIGKKVAARLRQPLGFLPCRLAHALQPPAFHYVEKGQQDDDQRDDAGSDQEHAVRNAAHRVVRRQRDEGQGRLRNIDLGQHVIINRTVNDGAGVDGPLPLEFSPVHAQPVGSAVHVERLAAFTINEQALAVQQRAAELRKARVGAQPRQQFAAIDLVDPHRRADHQLTILRIEANARRPVVGIQPRRRILHMPRRVPAGNQHAVAVDQCQRRVDRLLADAFACGDGLQPILDQLYVETEAVLVGHAEVAIGEKAADRVGLRQFGDVAPPFREEVRDRRGLLFRLQLELGQRVALQPLHRRVVTPENCARVRYEDEQRDDAFLVTREVGETPGFLRFFAHQRPPDTFWKNSG